MSENLQAIQHTRVLLGGPILDKKHIPHLLKRVPRQQAIRTGLMALPDRPVHFERFGHPVQPSIQATTEPYHVLQVVHPVTKKYLYDLEELIQRAGQASARENLHQVTEIIGAMKRDPANGVVAD
ncbi:hypothetical protein PanWU01x14_017450 [Parasponia andersonii]|uniref:Uncharacterized protein n=1 Tax=Parasponia andersonii TaxID=3476 RepID=A0A2P5E032_PARAD|nr:hypothetical protein PanWU01x14_017450 [Parasponia andersonii]